MTGVRSTNISNRVVLADEIVVNRDGSTALQPIASLATQLVGDGAIATAIAAASGKWVTFEEAPGPEESLNYPAGQEGRVYGDSEANNGIWLKLGASGSGSWQRIGPLPEADLTAVNEQIEGIEGDLDEERGDPLLNERYASAYVSEDGKTVLIGFGRDGVVDVNDTHPLLDPVFKYADVLPDGTVIRGLRHDNTFFPDVAAGADLSASIWISGAEVVLAKENRRCQISFATGEGITYANPVIAGSFARYIRDDGAAISTVSEEIVGTTSLDLLASTALVQILISGQSNSDGSGASPVVHGTAVRPGQAVMFNAGIRTRGAREADDPVPADHMYSLVDLYEITQEGPGCGLAFTLTGAGGLDADEALLVSAHGMGGQPYSAIKKGTVPWANTLAAIRRARVIANLNGLTYELGALGWIHGEADVANSKAVYKGKLVELQADATSDFNAITDESGEVLLFLDQIHNFTSYGYETSEVPFAQLEAALENPSKIFCVGSKYHLVTNPDGRHLPAASAARLGSYFARAIKQVRAGTPWLPLYCTGADRTGAEIRLHMHVPVAPLAIDTSVITNPGNYGITWSQVDGVARTISGVAIDGNDIVVTLTGDPGAVTSWSIGIAASGTVGANGGPTTGARSNFRDSAADLDIDGNAMPNHACHQLITGN